MVNPIETLKYWSSTCWFAHIWRVIMKGGEKQLEICNPWSNLVSYWLIMQSSPVKFFPIGLLIPVAYIWHSDIKCNALRNCAIAAWTSTRYVVEIFRNIRKIALIFPSNSKTVLEYFDNFIFKKTIHRTISKIWMEFLNLKQNFVGNVD